MHPNRSLNQHYYRNTKNGYGILFKYFKVSLDPEGHPNYDYVAQAAKDRVMIHLRLNESAAIT